MGENNEILTLSRDTYPIFYPSTTAPDNTKVFWIDTTNKVLKYYKNTTVGWVPVPICWT